MATPENTFIRSVHRHLPVELYVLKNNNQFHAGIADCWYSGPAGDLWIEYKFVALPKRENTNIEISLSELQKHWLRSRHAENRTVGVIVGCKEGGVYFPGTSWGAPCNSLLFRASIESRQKLAGMIVKLCLNQ